MAPKHMKYDIHTQNHTKKQEAYSEPRQTSKTERFAKKS